MSFTNHMTFQSTRVQLLEFPLRPFRRYCCDCSVWGKSCADSESKVIIFEMWYSGEAIGAALMERKVDKDKKIIDLEWQ